MAAPLRSSAGANSSSPGRSDSLTSLAAFIGIVIALVGGEGYEQANDRAAQLDAEAEAEAAAEVAAEDAAEEQPGAPGAEVAAPAPAVAEEGPNMIGLFFSEMFSPIDGLFVLLAFFTAYKVGSGQATD